jgi:hypothetical protein
LIFAPPLTFVITSEFWNIVPNPVTGNPSNMSGITTAFGPVYPVNVTSVAVLVHVQFVALDGFCHALVNKPAPARLARETDARTLLPLPDSVPKTPATAMLLIPPPVPPMIVNAAPLVIGEPLIVAPLLVTNEAWLLTTHWLVIPFVTAFVSSTATRACAFVPAMPCAAVAKADALVNAAAIMFD